MDLQRLHGAVEAAQAHDGLPEKARRTRQGGQLSWGNLPGTDFQSESVMNVLTQAYVIYVIYVFVGDKVCLTE